MKVIVDRDRCEGNAVCVRCCPDVFRLQDDDKVTILMDSIPENLRTRVQMAVNGCPRQALSLQE
jgi:ferredoxin